MKAWTGLLIRLVRYSQGNWSTTAVRRQSSRHPHARASRRCRTIRSSGSLGCYPASHAPIRGARAIPVDLGTMLLLFDNGYAVTIYSDADVRDEIIDALVLVNAFAVGSAGRRVRWRPLVHCRAFNPRRCCQ